MHTNRVADRKDRLADTLRIKNMIVQTNKNLGGRFQEQGERDSGSQMGSSGEIGAGDPRLRVGTTGRAGKEASLGRWRKPGRTGPRMRAGAEQRPERET